MSKEYIFFVRKIGNGNDLDKMLKKYLNDVEQIKIDNKEIKKYYTKLDNDM